MERQVLLINLGGPQDSNEIEPFLRDLFRDPFIFDLPLWEPFRLRLADWIAKKRAPKVAELYAAMGFGGGSPLVSETKKQAQELKLALERKTNQTWSVDFGMTCGFPNIREFPKESITPSSKNYLIPLYPQFSRSTTLSTAKIIETQIDRCPMKLQGWIGAFGLSPDFIRLTSDFILDFFQGQLNPDSFLNFDSSVDGGVEDWKNVDLVFSAHGIPMRLVNKGDQYVKSLETQVSGIESNLRKAGWLGKAILSFQSRVGPAKWTEPNTIEALKILGKEKSRIAVYPISFVSDHLETLEEIGVELKEIAMGSGAKNYYRIPAFGTYQPFIDYLADLVISESKGLIFKEKESCICNTLGGEKPSPGCLNSHRMKT